MRPAPTIDAMTATIDVSTRRRRRTSVRRSRPNSSDGSRRRPSTALAGCWCVHALPPRGVRRHGCRPGRAHRRGPGTGRSRRIGRLVCRDRLDDVVVGLVPRPGVGPRVFTSPSTPTGGVFAPNAVGTVRGQTGIACRGRWQWGSGTQHCDWIVGGARCDDGIAAGVLLPSRTTSPSTTRGTPSGCEAPARSTSRSRTCSFPRAHLRRRWSCRHRRADQPVPELHAARSRHRRHRARHRSTGARRVCRPGDREEAAVLESVAGREFVRADRVRTCRGGVAGGTVAAAERGGRRVGGRPRRATSRRRDSCRDATGRSARSVDVRRRGQHRLDARRAAPRCTTRARWVGASVTYTS